jgi:hypothetical protein
MGYRSLQYMENEFGKYIRTNGLMDGRIAKSISMIADSLDLLERLGSMPFSSGPAAPPNTPVIPCIPKTRHEGKFRFYDRLESCDLMALLSTRVVLNSKMMFVSDLIGKIQSVDDGVFDFDGVRVEARNDDEDSRDVHVMALLELEICARFIREAEELERQYGPEAYPEIIAILRRTGRMED